MTSAGRATKVLITDDSSIYRRILTQVLEEFADVELVGTARDGGDALMKLARTEVDLVLLDVEMPGMDGLATLEEISKQHPAVSVIMVSGLSDRAAEITIRALQHGAIDFVPKPVSADADQSRKELVRALRPLIAISRMRRMIRRAEGGQPTEAATTRRTVAGTAPLGVAAPATAGVLRGAKPPQEISLVAIGSSTGGPRALSDLFGLLAPEVAVPILVVQHMPVGFTRSLAAQLDKRCGLQVKEAEEGEAIIPGVVLIAPGGQHLVVRRTSGALVAGLSASPPVNSCRPSVDVLFRSLVGAVAAPVLTVVLTGMGADGADGVAALSRHHSYNLVQEQSSCVVFGMPKAVWVRGLADEMAALEQIAARINQLGQRPGRLV